jgi:pyruvate/2-oxoglutarate dehydrogenase complex dihydrolipoamide dehydrogenase (E3) component
VSRVGLNETEAREQQIPHHVTVYPLSELDRAIADEAARPIDGWDAGSRTPDTDRG